MSEPVDGREADRPYTDLPHVRVTIQVVRDDKTVTTSSRLIGMDQILLSARVRKEVVMAEAGAMLDTMIRTGAL